MTHILLIEDFPIVARATLNLIDEEIPGNQTTVCMSAAQATATLVSGQRIDKILLDLDIPGAHGLSLAMSIRELGLENKCCIVTGTDRSEYAIQCRSLGFRGYLLKAMPMEKFQRLLREFLLSDVSDFICDMDFGKSNATVRITRRQTQILDQVKAGLTSKQIAAKLGLSIGTVDNHIAATMMALGAESRSHAVSKALELGLIRVGSYAAPAA